MKNLADKMASSNASLTVNQTLDRQTKLRNIFESSGCKSQACTSLQGMMPTMRSANYSGQGDLVVMKLAAVG